MRFVWGQDATLLDSVGHWDGFGGFTVVQDTGHHAIMELTDKCDKLGWAAKFSHDFTESILTNCIKSLGLTNEGHVEITTLFFYLSWSRQAAKIMSVVPRPVQKPHWLLGRRPCSRLQSKGLWWTQARVLPAIDRRDIPWWLSQS